MKTVHCTRIYIASNKYISATMNLQQLTRNDHNNNTDLSLPYSNSTNTFIVTGFAFVKSLKKHLVITPKSLFSLRIALPGINRSINFRLLWKHVSVNSRLANFARHPRDIRRSIAAHRTEEQRFPFREIPSTLNINDARNICERIES